MRRLALALALLAACSSPPRDATPEGTVAMLLEESQRLERDPEARARLFDLLALQSRDALAERAAMTSALAGWDLAPWEMIVDERAPLRFEPAQPPRWVVHREGPHAEVRVPAAHGSAEATFQLVRERERWRVLLDVPRIDRGQAEPAVPPPPFVEY